MENSQFPIFIIGNPRSGTTLLRLMFTCHPYIIVPPEGGFIIQLYEKYNDFKGSIYDIKQFSRDVINCKKLEEWKIPEESLKSFLISLKPQNYSDLVSGVYYFYSYLNGKKVNRWGDKNNYYLHHIPRLVSIFPDAKFIHIVRDGRDVACSYRDLANIKGKYAPSLPNTVGDIATEWRNNIQKVISSKGKIAKGNFYEIRYEDLVENPESSLKAVCNYLGERYSEQMLLFYKKNKEERLEPAVYDRWKQKNKEKVDTSRIGRWKEELSLEEINVFEQVAGGILQHYDYSLTSNSHIIDKEVF